MSVDPLGEKYNRQSNYSFCSNQVVQSREIEGLEADYDQNDYDNYYNNDYLDHTGESNWQPAGFDGGLGPMDGQLDEVVVGNSYKEVFDKYDQIDNDRDGYGGKDDDRDQNTEAAESIIERTQLIGAGLTILGGFLTITGVGAPLGTALMATGLGMSIAGTTESIAFDIIDDNPFNYYSHIIETAGLVVPDLYLEHVSGEIYGLNNLIVEIDFLGLGYSTTHN